MGKTPPAGFDVALADPEYLRGDALAGLEMAAASYERAASGEVIQATLGEGILESCALCKVVTAGTDVSRDNLFTNVINHGIGNMFAAGMSPAMRRPEGESL